MGDRVVEQLPEVTAHRRFATADVDVEDLHPMQLVDHRLALGGGQLMRAAAARRGEALHARQVADVGDNLSTNKTPRPGHGGQHKVELCFTPTYAYWANPIEAQFGSLRTSSWAPGGRTVNWVVATQPTMPTTVEDH